MNQIKVWLGGDLMKDVTSFDTANGQVTVILRNPDGNVVIHLGKPLTKMLTGVVTATGAVD